MKIFFTRKVWTLMLILSMFSFMGCASKDEKAETKILSSLQEKYGEEFVLDGIGGSWGTMNNNTLKAIVRPKHDATLKVPVEITKDLKKVYDKYLNQAVAKNAEQPIQELAKRIWPDSKLIIANDTGLTYPEHSDTGMSYKEFLDHYPMNTQLVKVYLNADDYMDAKGNMNSQAESEHYLSFANQLADYQYINSLISIIYLTPEAYEKFEEAKKSKDTVDNFYSDEEKKSGVLSVVTRVGYTLGMDGEVEESPEKILGFIETWKEKRVKSLEQRGGL